MPASTPGIVWVTSVIDRAPTASVISLELVVVR